MRTSWKHMWAFSELNAVGGWMVAAAVVLACCGSAVASDGARDSHAIVHKSVAPGEDAWGGAVEAVLFYTFAAVTLLSGLALCLSGNIVRMAVYLFFTLGAVAVLYFLLLANFIAVIQLIVYAGGTLILLVFGVMLTSKSPWARFDVKRSELIGGGVVCALLGVALLLAVTTASWPGQTDEVVTGPTVASIGRALLTTYLVPFEVVSVLLLVVMIGAAYLARQEKE